MSKRNRKTDQKVIKKRISAGCGQGRGNEYKPWLHIQDVPSSGLVHRVKGWKTGRVHHFLSTLEVNYFYVLEWSQLVTDIREQFPLLPLEETLVIADQCGVHHPTEPRTQEPIVMTTDFVITSSKNDEPFEQARTVKPSEKLQSKRVLEKLEIERRYWQSRNIDWGIVTERDIPGMLVKNVELLHGYISLADRLPLTEDEVGDVATVLLPQMGHIPLRQATSSCDRQFGLEPGSSLAVVYHLLANRQWQIDMNIAIEPGKELALVTTIEPGAGR